MKMRRESRWICENAQRLEEKYAGRWVIFNANEGVVSSGPDLGSILKAAKRSRAAVPFVFHVPSRDELSAPLPAGPAASAGRSGSRRR